MNYIVSDKNKDYIKVIEKIINERKKEIFDFFKKEKCKLNFNVYIYDTKEELVSGLKDRGFKNSPDYMVACFKDEDNSLNFFVPKDNPKDNEFSKEEYDDVIFHELIHAIEYALFGEKPEWFNEGIAKYLDGTYSKGMKYLFDNYINKTLIPSGEEIEKEFGMHNYDSYDYAYIMISYLIETMGHNNFLKLLEDENLFNKTKQNLLLKAICYYNELIYGTKYYNADLNNPHWLFHGSSKKLDVLLSQQSHDSNNNKINIDNALFVTSSLKIASAYAFKDSIKEYSKNLNWNFEVTNYENYPIMTMENVNIKDNLEGYIYVFCNNGKALNEPIDSLQFKIYDKVIPYDVMEVKYNDYKDNYQVINNKHNIIV